MASSSRLIFENLCCVTRRGYATTIPIAPPKPPEPPAPSANPNRIYTSRKSSLHSEYYNIIQSSPFFLLLSHQNFTVAKFTTLRKELAKLKPSTTPAPDQPPAKLSVIRHAIFGAAVKSARPRVAPLLSSVQGPAAVLAFPTVDPPQLKAVLRTIDRAIPKALPSTSSGPSLKVISAPT